MVEEFRLDRLVHVRVGAVHAVVGRLESDLYERVRAHVVRDDEELAVVRKL
jgi:hypothetical protein